MSKIKEIPRDELLKLLIKFSKNTLIDFKKYRQEVNDDI
jgi:hypothetical protein